MKFDRENLHLHRNESKAAHIHYGLLFRNITKGFKENIYSLLSSNLIRTRHLQSSLLCILKYSKKTKMYSS